MMGSHHAVHVARIDYHVCGIGCVYIKGSVIADMSGDFVVDNPDLEDDLMSQYEWRLCG